MTPGLCQLCGVVEPVGVCMQKTDANQFFKDASVNRGIKAMTDILKQYQ